MAGIGGLSRKDNGGARPIKGMGGDRVAKRLPINRGERFSLSRDPGSRARAEPNWVKRGQARNFVSAKEPGTGAITRDPPSCQQTFWSGFVAPFPLCR